MAQPKFVQIVAVGDQRSATLFCLDEEGQVWKKQIGATAHSVFDMSEWSQITSREDEAE